MAPNRKGEEGTQRRRLPAQVRLALPGAVTCVYTPHTFSKGGFSCAVFSTAASAAAAAAAVPLEFTATYLEGLCQIRRGQGYLWT